jgi:hypothetical protein
MLDFEKFLSFGLMGVLVLLTGCAATGGNQAGEMEIRSGVIEQIESVQIQSNHIVESVPWSAVLRGLVLAA